MTLVNFWTFNEAMVGIPYIYTFMMLCHYICYKWLFDGLMAFIKKQDEWNKRKLEIHKHTDGTESNAICHRRLQGLSVISIICHKNLVIHFKLVQYVLLMIISMQRLGVSNENNTQIRMHTRKDGILVCPTSVLWYVSDNNLIIFIKIDFVTSTKKL